MSRIVFYLALLLCTIILIYIVAVNPPTGEIKALLIVLASGALTAIAMAFTSKKKKDVNDSDKIQ